MLCEEAPQAEGGRGELRRKKEPGQEGGQRGKMPPYTPAGKPKKINSIKKTKKRDKYFLRTCCRGYHRALCK